MAKVRWTVAKNQPVNIVSAPGITRPVVSNLVSPVGIVCPARGDFRWQQGGAAYLSSDVLLDSILTALDNNEPCSIISVGATEAFVLAQYTVLSEEEILHHPEAQVANRGEISGFYHRGIRFPNIAARDEAMAAIRDADIVGYNLLVKPACEFTERVFAACNLYPSRIFEANLRRVIMFSKPDKFAAMLRGKKVLLVNSQAAKVKAALQEHYKQEMDCNIIGAVSIYEYEEISRVKREIARYDFDLCLLAAGINAVILAPFISKSLGKVAFDIGSGMESLVTGEIIMDQWLTYIIGIDNIMSM